MMMKWLSMTITRRKKIRILGSVKMKKNVKEAKMKPRRITFHFQMLVVDVDLKEFSYALQSVEHQSVLESISTTLILSHKFNVGNFLKPFA